MTTEAERERAEERLARDVAEAIGYESDAYEQALVIISEGLEAARREELHRTREYLKKLGWSEADIAAWENWHG